MHGVRFRKNFKTREEAAAEKAALEIKALQTVAGLRQIATALTEEQVREAEALFQRTESKSRPLSFYVDFAFEHYREPERQKSLADAIAAYVAAKEHEFRLPKGCPLSAVFEGVSTIPLRAVRLERRPASAK